MLKTTLSLLFLFLVACPASCGTTGAKNVQEAPPPATTAEAYPRIVLYSLSWCPHCKQAKEYFSSRNIPYVNRDVEQDDEARDLLLNKYKSNSVPVIVIGNDEAVIKGFSPELFEQSLRKLKKPQTSLPPGQ